MNKTRPLDEIFLLGMVIGIALMTLIVIIVLALTLEPSNDEEIEEKMITYWACMDGCYEMLDLIYGVEADNPDHKKLHHNCSDRCVLIYWPEAAR